MKHTASEKKSSKSRDSSIKRRGLGNQRASAPDAQFVVCVRSGGYVDLELLKVYKIRRDANAKAQGLLRVVDRSGEDYLYPEAFFRQITAPQPFQSGRMIRLGCRLLQRILRLSVATSSRV
jgi:hypothetical protein